MSDSIVGRIRARWEAFQPTRVGTIWALIYTVGGTMALGFTAGGWMTAGGAQEMADKAAAKARAQLAATVCVERFLAAADAEAQLASLKSISNNFQRRRFIEDGGWTVMPGNTSGTAQAASLCAAALYKHPDTVATS